MPRAGVVLLLLWGISASANARDRTTGGYEDYSRVTCPEYVQYRREKGAGWAFVEGWIRGYLTAYNALVDDTYDIIADHELYDTENAIESYCKGNPKSWLAAAIEQHTRELHPNRARAAD